jgi:hypothetical protein
MNSSLTAQARNVFASDSCVIEQNFKRGRKDWFCWECWQKLPEQIQKDLKYLNKNWQVSYQKAMEILENRGVPSKAAPDTQA